MHLKPDTAIQPLCKIRAIMLSSLAMTSKVIFDALPPAARIVMSSDWAALETQTLDQVILYLSNTALTTSTLWPADQGLSSIQLVCRHWFHRSSTLV